MSVRKAGYTIGLDIGTASVGWAVIDDDFNLLRGKKRIHDENGNYLRKRTNLWGARLFTNAETAAGRRLKRGARRRIARRVKRLAMLRGIFANEVNRVDDNFFARLDESFFQKDDHENKKHTIKYPLFDGKIGPGESFANDQKYYEKYPTIYHLRERLVDDKSQADIRLVFLALSHITKFRGHFVSEEIDFNFANINIYDSVKNLIEIWNKYFHENSRNDLIVRENCEMEIEKELKNKKYSPSWKTDEIVKLLEIAKNSEFANIIKLVVGNKANLKKVFSLDEELKIKASDEDFEEKIAKLTDEQQEIVYAAQKVNNDILLDESLKNGSLSQKMIEKYETHQKQLTELKKFAKDNGIFREIFGPEIDKTNFGIYTKYIQGVGNPAKTYGPKIDEFYNCLKKIIAKKVGENDEFFARISSEMDLGNYLPKQRVYTNGAIPFQVHEHEMKQIIENQKIYYPDIEWEKIVPLMKFRIPYYVGILAKNPGWISRNNVLEKNENSYAKNSWVVRKKDGEITPWNFDEMINKEESAMNFIDRMTNFDTYLPNEKVLPVKSLTYQKYAVLNELTKVKIGQVFLSAEQKTKVFRELFAGGGKSGRVSKKEFVKFINAEFEVSGITEENVSGIDGRGFNAVFTTAHDLEKVVGFAKVADESNFAKFDEIVKMQTVFEDKKVLSRQLREKFGDFLTDDEISLLSKKYYSGWGRLSRKILTEIYDQDGNNILWLLENDKGHRNFQQLITDEKLPFAKFIEDANFREDSEKLSYELVESLAGSPSIKRGIWQSLKIVDEIVEFMGKKPKNIAIEFARENQNSAQTNSRKRNISKIIDGLKNEFDKEAIDKKLLDQFENKDFTQRLQLYFMQNGKDMYDGSAIDISRLMDYDIDHIYPQSLIKDDSIDNKVLVSRENNRKKSDGPAGSIFANPQMINFWRKLKNSGAISEVKFARLQKTEFSDSDLRGFINRQLVETRQIMKNVATILREIYGDDVKILTPKAKFAHELRELNNWPKNREINDFHHAHDAYLNAIVGVFREKMGFEDFAKKLRQNYANRANKDEFSADILRRQANLQARAMDVWRYVRVELKDTYFDRITGEEKHFYENKKIDDSMAVVSREIDGIVKNLKIWDQDVLDDDQVWWNNEVLAKIGKAFDYRDVNVVRKTEPASGAYSLEGNLKKGFGTLNIKNNREISRYGGSNLDSTSISVLRGGKIIGIPLQSKREIRSSDLVIFNNTKYVNKNKKYRVVTSPTESASIQQFGFSMKDIKNINDFQNQRDENIEISREIIERILSNIQENGINVNILVDQLYEKPKQNVLAGTSIKQYGQIAIVFDLLKLMGSGASRGMKALKSIGGPEDVRFINKTGSMLKGSKIIYQSPTGLYETRKIV